MDFSLSKEGSHWIDLGKERVLPDLFLKGSLLIVEGIVECKQVRTKVGRLVRKLLHPSRQK